MFKSGSKHAPLILVIVISFAFVGFALAQDTSVSVDAEVGITPPPPNSGPIRPLDLARQKAMELKQGTANAKADWQNASSGPERRPMPAAKDRMASTSNLMQKVRGAIAQHAGVIKNRFRLAMSHFERFVERIETRIDKMAAAGVDTASVEAQLEVAKTAQASAAADIQAVHDYVDSIEESTDRTQVRTQLQALVKTANESIKEAHLELQKTVRALVALAKENKPVVETSASVEAEAAVEASNQ
jgi:glutamine synthetase type III